MVDPQEMQRRIAQEQARDALLRSIATGGMPMGGPGGEYGGPAPGQGGMPQTAPIPWDAPSAAPDIDASITTGSIPTDPTMINSADPRTGQQAAFAQAFGGQSGPPLPNDYQAMVSRVNDAVAPGPLYQQYMQALTGLPEPVHGIKGHLKAGLRGLAMKGVGGLIYGLADPSSVNWSFKQAQAQNLLPGVQAEERGKEAQLKRAGDIAGMTGYDPLTGQRTPTAMYHDALIKMSGRRADNAERRTDVYEQTAEEKADLNEKKFVKDLFNTGALNTSEGRAWAATQLNMPFELKDKFMAGAIKVDENFNFIDTRTGQVLQDPKGKPLISGVATQEKNRTERAHIIAEERRVGHAETARHNLSTEGARERELTRQENKDAETQADKEVSPFEKDRPAKVKARADEIRDTLRKQAPVQSTATPQRSQLTSSDYNKTITSVPRGWTADAWKRAVDAEMKRTGVSVQ